jgi:hypothetical protein
VELVLSYSDGVRKQGSRRLNPSTDQAPVMFPQLWDLLETLWKRRTRVRHLRLTCSRTAGAQVQLDLFARPEDQERQERITASLDAVRKRFGQGAVVPGLVLGTGGRDDAAPGEGE